MARRRYTAEQVDAAVQALGDPARFGHAQEIVTHAAPGLQQVLAERGLRAVRTLVSEETRLGMLVGVAIGLELAQELVDTPHQEEDPA